MKLSKIRIGKYFILLLALPFYTVPSLSHAAEDVAIARRIGWVPTQTYLNYCPGYYAKYPVNRDLSPKQTRVSAARASVFQTGRSTLQDEVLIEQFHRNIESASGFIDRDDKGQIKTITLDKQVVITEPDKRILAEHAVWHQNETWEAERVWYRLDQNPTAWGHASRAEKRKFGKYRLEKTSYTTCPPGDHFWRLETAQIDLNPTSGRGHARHTWLYVEEIPVAYLPFFDFPIDKRRQSGVLFPAFENDDRSGFTLSVPYYLNLAPNYDATITPRAMTKRGLMLEGLFRYLFPSGQGNTDITMLPADQAFPDFQEEETRDNVAGKRVDRLNDFDNNRWAIHWEDTHQYNPSWSSSVIFNQVSDDYYFQDFGQSVFATTQNQLNQEAVLNYANEHWTALGRVQHFQTLHPINESIIDDSYSRLPQFVFNADYPDIHHVDYQLNSEFVYFDKPRHPDTDQIFTTGGRAYLAPIIRYPFNRVYGYVTPQMKFSLTHYQLEHPLLGDPHRVDRALPLFSVDSGLFFERNLRLRGTDYQQTLEPRLYYLYVPFHRQTDIPLFDTSLYTFDSNQLFRDNRFSGIDRIGDANQITAAITSRLLEDETGTEKISASIGQIYYFRDRLVTLCNTHDCSDQNTIGAFSDKTRTSPIVANLGYHLTENWSANADTSWDPDSGKNLYSSANIHYALPQKQIVDASYYVTHNAEITDNKVSDLRQAKLAFYWPIKERWGTIGGWYYNLTQHRSQSYFYGIEYSDCCWATRVVAERQFVALNPVGSPTFDTNVYLQIRLKGLGNIGTSDAGHLLSDNIPGYRDLLTT